MKNLHGIVKQAEKFASDNSPAILTALGLTGVVTTAYLAAKASFKASDVLEEARKEKSWRLTNQEDTHYSFTTKEWFELLWKLYIPAVASGTVTCAAIVLANRIGTRRTAAMTAAFTLSERAYSEYKEKVVETIGKNKEKKVRSDIAQDGVRRDDQAGNNLVLLTDGTVPCKDAWSGQYFASSMEDIKSAMNAINYEVLNHGYASLTDLYHKIGGGLEPNKDSDNLGWNSDKLLEIVFDTALSDKNGPVLVMDFGVAPIRNFFRAH